MFETRIPRHSYTLGSVLWVLEMILLAGCSMRATEKAIDVGCRRLGFPSVAPDWSTGRLWLLRVGFFKLQQPLAQADDWVWIVDHTNQVGIEKCLVILGIRLSELPERPLRHEDVVPLALLPVTKTSGPLVAEQLNAATSRTGVPRLIVADAGSDLRCGIRIFCEEYEQTSYILDIKHKTASELKRELAHSPSWMQFTALAASCARQLQQTELAPLRPPNQRSKARFMNLGPLVDWGDAVLNVLDGRTTSGRAVEFDLGTDKARVMEKLGWIQGFRTELAVWGELHGIATVAEDAIRQDGYTDNSADRLRRSLRGIAHTQPGRRIRTALIDFVQTEAAKAKPGERLLGSSEVLESIFGTFKKIEGDQRRSGLTSSILVIPTLTGSLDGDTVRQALSTTRTTDIYDWAHKHMDKTVQSKRRRLLSELQPHKTAAARPAGTNMESGHGFTRT